MAEQLEQAIADERGDAAVLRKNGDPRVAGIIERICDRVAAAAEDWLTWKSEADARLRSGKGLDYFRRRFPELQALGLAKRIAGKRYYRQAAIPVRANTSAAREAGRRGERRAS